MMPFCNSIRNIWRSGTRFRTQTKKKSDKNLPRLGENAEYVRQ